jgi:hypothetical protein
VEEPLSRRAIRSVEGDAIVVDCSDALAGEAGDVKDHRRSEGAIRRSDLRETRSVRLFRSNAWP